MNGTLRFIMEGYLEILIAIGLNLVYFEETTSEFAFLPGVKLSNAFALFFTIVAICLPIFITGYYISNEEHWLEP